MLLAELERGEKGGTGTVTFGLVSRTPTTPVATPSAPLPHGDICAKDGPIPSHRR